MIKRNLLDMTDNNTGKHKKGAIKVNIYTDGGKHIKTCKSITEACKLVVEIYDAEVNFETFRNRVNDALLETGEACCNNLVIKYK